MMMSSHSIFMSRVGTTIEWPYSRSLLVRTDGYNHFLRARSIGEDKRVYAQIDARVTPLGLGLRLGFGLVHVRLIFSYIST